MARISFRTFGCKVNQYETEQAIQQAIASGHEVVGWGDEADVQIVHTCSVTKAAVRDGRQELRRAHKRNPGSQVIGTGCAARTDASTLIPLTEITLKDDLTEAVRDLGQHVRMDQEFPEMVQEPIVQAQSRIRALLKIHDGCYFRCSFCIVPNARPVESSKPVEEAVEEAKALVAQGHKEIVLTGVRITGYRPETYLRSGLVELVKRLSDVPGLKRVRLTSLYPNEVKNDLLRAIADSPNACLHLHLALQSGDDGVLQAMKRHYTSEVFEEVVANARAVMPDVSLTTDIIAGFPGESDEAFQNSKSLMERVGFSKAHVFTYSKRPGTPGADMLDQVPENIARDRTRELISVAAKTGRAYREKFIGKELLVIAEQQKNPGVWTGQTDTYLEVEFPSLENLRGKMIRVKVDACTDEGISGTFIGCVED